MVILIILNLFLSIISIIPNWNLGNSAKNILTENSYTYTITHREMYGLIAKLNKTIVRSTEDQKITHKNDFYVKIKLEDGDNENSPFTKYEDAKFENIESFYKLDDRKIICPIGKHQPIHIIDVDETNINLEEIDNADINKTNEWDLKCYRHNEGYFFTYYFMNGDKQVYNLEGTTSYTKLDNLILYQELYDFKLVNKDKNKENGPYPICALVKWDNYIRFLASEYIFSESDTGKTQRRSSDKNRILTIAKKYTQGYFNN